MNRIIRAFAAFIVSICLILAPAVSYAASSWTPTGATSSGSRTIVSATKGGLKSVVSLAPSVLAVGSKLLRTANTAALLYAAAQLINDGTNYVLDPANNQVKFIRKPKVWYANLSTGTISSPSLDAVCAMYAAARGYTVSPTSKPTSSGNLGTCFLVAPNGTHAYSVNYGEGDPIPSTKPIGDFAEQVIKNARAGHAPSQQILQAAAIEQVASGAYDKDLLAGAVPINDSRPVVPAVPGSQTGAPDEGISGATPGETAENARVEAERNKKAAQAAADAAKAAADAARQAADDAQDIINSAVDEAIKEAARQAAETAAQAAADAKAVADRAAQVAAETAAQADRAAQAAVADAKALLDAAKAASDATAESIAAAQAKVDAAVKAAEAAAKEAAKAKEENAKPFELPAFCAWATKVCDFVDWAKADPQLEEPDMTKPEIQDLTKYDTVDISQKYVTATGQCPPAADLNINFGVVKLSYEPLCIILDKLSGVIVAVAYISVGFMIIRTV